MPPGLRRPRRRSPRAQPRGYAVHLPAIRRSRVDLLERRFQRCDGRLHRVLRRRAWSRSSRACRLAVRRGCRRRIQSYPGLPQPRRPAGRGGLDHYSELATTTFPHLRGGIAGHSFYLASQGGHNAGCTATPTLPATHVLNCTVDVTPVGQTRATQIFYEGFTSLTETANFCDARNATVAVAGADAEAISAAWEAVGLTADCAPSPPPPPPACLDVPTATLPFESAHPYADDLRVRLDLRQRDPRLRLPLQSSRCRVRLRLRPGAGCGRQRLGQLHGELSGRDAPLNRIPTSVGSVVLLSDSFVSAEGFVVDSVTPC